jgi:hypothetical protein
MKEVREDHRHAEAGFEEDVLEVLKFQIALYPQLSLIDLYKSFFQDEFGPGHLLIDVEKARAGLHEEVLAMTSRGRRIVEPCGRGNQFCRIPLDLVADGIIEENDYFSAFLSGSSVFNLPDTEGWKKTWLGILEVLRLERKCISGFSEDSEFIMEALEKGTWTMNHSNHYRRLYDPHYRIFRIEYRQVLCSSEQ